MELCDASLDQLFRKSNDPKKCDLPKEYHIKIFLQLALGLEYIHSKNLVHRDIKPSNVLIIRRPEKDEEIIVKWADFGLSKSVNERGTYTVSGVRGTKNWYAPEVLGLFTIEEKEESAPRGTVKSDVFALGLVFGYLLLDGKHLYGSNEFEITPNIIFKKPINMQGNFAFTAIVQFPFNEIQIALL